jgi:hypothetical protein
MATAMKRQRLMLALTVGALLGAGACFLPRAGRAQSIDFGQIEAFESMGSGTQRGGQPAKTIIDDGDRHMVFITVLEANTETKVYWRSAEGGGTDRASVIPGPGLQVFQTAGEFRLEAVGDDTRSVKYGYMLFRMKK